MPTQLAEESNVMIFSMLYHELVCHVEPFSVKLIHFTRAYVMTKESQQIVLDIFVICCNRILHVICLYFVRLLTIYLIFDKFRI